MINHHNKQTHMLFDKKSQLPLVPLTRINIKIVTVKVHQLISQLIFAKQARITDLKKGKTELFSCFSYGRT